MSGDRTGGNAARPSTLWPLLLIASLLAAAWASGLLHILSFGVLARELGAVRAFARDRPVAAVASFIALYAAAAGISLPGGTVLTLAGGLVFGTLLGGAASVVGASLGATLLFLAARHALGARLAERSGPRLDRIRSGFERDGVSYLLALRLIPVVPFWLVNLAAGLLDVSLSRFVWTTAVGIVPGTFVFASVGAGIDAVFDAAHPPGPGVILRPDILLPLLALSALSLAPVAWRRLSRRRHAG